MKERTIFVFPGQGAQYYGMGRDIFYNFAAARHVFEEVSDVAHCDVADTCFGIRARKLNLPKNTSLATFAHSVSIARVIESELGKPMHEIAYAVSGHSMGQYTALHIAGALKIDDAVNLLIKRAKYMSGAASKDSGMICIVGMSHEWIDNALCIANKYGFAAVANHNSETQFVISGQTNALNVILNLARCDGARIAQELKVSVPAHCELMLPARKRFEKDLKDIAVNAPKIKVFSNHTAKFVKNPDEIKHNLAAQLTNGVRWCEIMQNFPKYNITRAYELGPGRTLTRLINRANVSAAAMHTGAADNLRLVLKKLSADKSR